MKNRKAIILTVFLLLAFFTGFSILIMELNPFSIFNFYHRFKGRLDEQRGREYTMQYVQEKYGFEPEIVYVHPVMDENRSELFYQYCRLKYTGSIFCVCQMNGEHFETLIRIRDRAGCDNYQEEEIWGRIDEELENLTNLRCCHGLYTSDLYVTDSELESYCEKNGFSPGCGFISEYYDETMELKPFLEKIDIYMELESDIDLDEIDYEAVYRVFPEGTVRYYKEFPEGEKWGLFPEQQTLETDGFQIMKYSPKLVGGAEVSTCDGTEFTVENGVVQQGVWEEDSIKYGPVEYDPEGAVVYTCSFETCREVKFGLPYGWKPEKETENLPDGVIFYQYRDKDGIIRNGRLYDGYTPFMVYTDMLTIVYANRKK